MPMEAVGKLAIKARVTTLKERGFIWDADTFLLLSFSDFGLEIVVTLLLRRLIIFFTAFGELLVGLLFLIIDHC